MNYVEQWASLVPSAIAGINVANMAVGFAFLADCCG
jgi:hypothetical protein